MTKFKAGDKVRVKDEVLTNEEGDSMWQSWRGTEAVVVRAGVGVGNDFWVKEVGAEDLSISALLNEKHLERFDEFKVGDWVFIKDEPLIFSEGMYSSHRLPDRGTWAEVYYEYPDGDLHVRNDSRDELRLVHKRHVTSNPFSVGDRVVVADDNTWGSGDEQTPAVTEEMQSSPFVTHQPDEDGDIRVNGYFVHKRHVTPFKPKIDLPVTLGEINALAGVTAEAVDHPEHYNRGAFETIDVIEDWGLNFNVGNAVKYISRYEHKNNPKEDLHKAIWYLEREIDSLN